MRFVVGPLTHEELQMLCERSVLVTATHEKGLFLFYLEHLF